MVHDFHAEQAQSIEALAPTTEAFTRYDEVNFAIYLTLLHASADGWSDELMCRSILKVDPKAPGATEILRSHLARARWLSTDGRHHLLQWTGPANRNQPTSSR